MRLREARRRGRGREVRAASGLAALCTPANPGPAPAGCRLAARGQVTGRVTGGDSRRPGGGLRRGGRAPPRPGPRARPRELAGVGPYLGVVAAPGGRVCRVPGGVGDTQSAGGAREPELRKGCRGLGPAEERGAGRGSSCGHMPCGPGRWAGDAAPPCRAPQKSGCTGRPQQSFSLTELSTCAVVSAFTSSLI